MIWPEEENCSEAEGYFQAFAVNAGVIWEKYVNFSANLNTNETMDNGWETTFLNNISGLTSFLSPE